MLLNLSRPLAYREGPRLRWNRAGHSCREGLVRRHLSSGEPLYLRHEGLLLNLLARIGHLVFPEEPLAHRQDALLRTLGLDKAHPDFDVCSVLLQVSKS